MVSLILLGSVAHAATYRWVDDKGVIHFTDNPDHIPARYQKRVQELPSVTSPPQSSVPPQEQPEVAAPRQTPEKPLYGGLDEGAWRGRFAALRTEIKSLQDGLPAKREELAQLRRRWVISMGRTPSAGETESGRFTTRSALSTPGRHREAYFARLAEVEQDEARIAELEKQLAALEVEASRAGVPFEWR